MFFSINVESNQFLCVPPLRSSFDENNTMVFERVPTTMRVVILWRYYSWTLIEGELKI